MLCLEMFWIPAVSFSVLSKKTVSKFWIHSYNLLLNKEHLGDASMGFETITSTSARVSPYQNKYLLIVYFWLIRTSSCFINYY